MNVAVKVSKREWHDLSEDEKKGFRQEIDRHCKLEHENVVRVYGWFDCQCDKVWGDGFGVVMELCGQGSVLDFLETARTKKKK
eukprot:TRINITY_DN4288_c0_g1_i1.p3 TRINITY_DN4288_c0_g1~~TRINITY_DN4288_c0_g1_i1.p3  ORF type:complete len:83 (+),score=15.51 TRINITY_DN4288_c0_g1_i1:252-500(+)